MDIDLVVEGDALSLAPALAQELGGTVAATSQFGTAKLKVREMTLDLATARQERYSRPGALPEVRPSGIRDDLARRDFTVNAMAMRLDPAAFAGLLDPHGGEADLAGGLLRVLHPKSFQDDPTRLLRALRYEGRLGFRLATETEALLRRDSAFLAAVSGDRVRHEMERIFQEARPEDALARAEALGVLTAVTPALTWPGALHLALQAFRQGGAAASPLLFLAFLAVPLSPEEGKGLAGRLSAPARWSRIVQDTTTLGQSLTLLQSSDLRPSLLDKLLRNLQTEAVEAWSISAASPQARERLRHYLQSIRDLKTSLSGDDLLSLGVPRGPLVGRLLEELRAALLDGQVRSREEEEALVRRRLAEAPREQRPS
jgi:tRNA nucleotidyltransferase (CCA-adding enzyme)